METSSGMAPPEARYTWRCPNCEWEVCEGAASHHAFDLTGCTFSQTLPVMPELVRRPKRSRSPQGRGTATTDEGQRLHKVLKTEPTIKQRSRWAEAASRRQHASTQSLKAPSHQLEAVAQALEAKLAESKKLRNAILHQGVAGEILQALQDDGRQRALALVGISSAAAAPDGKPWGERIDALVCDWATTYRTVLTLSHKKEIAACFGRPFIVFLNASDAVSDMDRVLGKVRVDNLAHTLSLGMPWKKRRVIMEVVDSLYRETDIEGARSAYLAFFGRTSWEEEGLVVLAELAYARDQQLRTGQ